MPTRLLMAGLPETLAQNEIVAMPSRQCNGFVIPDDAVLEGNTAASSSGMAGITVVDGQFFTTAGFIRCTDAPGCVINLKHI